MILITYKKQGNFNVNSTLESNVTIQNKNGELVKRNLTRGDVSNVKSVRGVKLRFNEKKNEFLCDMTQDELNALLTSYPQNIKGELITSCNVKNRRDPFITSLSIKLKNDQLLLDPENVKDRILVAFARKHPLFTDDPSKLGSRTPYLISDRVTKVQEIRNRSSKSKEAWKKYFKLNNADKRLFARSLAHKPSQYSDDVDITFVEQYLERSIENDGRIGEFLHLCQLDKQALSIQDTFVKAKEKATVLRRNNQWVFNGIYKLGNTNSDVLKFLGDPNNFDILDEIEKVINAK